MKEVYMTEPEISRCDIFSEINQKKMTQQKAAEVLGLSQRHVRRLYAKFKESGIISLVSQQRGKPSNHQLPTGLKARISELVTIELYEGFGPTFMREKLKELHGIKISIETTRRIMIQNGVWGNIKKSALLFISNVSVEPVVGNSYRLMDRLTPGLKTEAILVF